MLHCFPLLGGSMKTTSTVSSRSAIPSRKTPASPSTKRILFILLRCAFTFASRTASPLSSTPITSFTVFCRYHTNGSDSTVSIHHHISLIQARQHHGCLIELFCLRWINLIKGCWRDPEPASAQFIPLIYPFPYRVIFLAPSTILVLRSFYI